MKKLISTFLMSIMLAIAIPAISITATAQTRHYESNGRQSGRMNRNYGNTYYYDGYNGRSYGSYDNGRPNVYDRHRQAINIGVATGAGAVLGALIGGGKGALIGAGAGAVGGVIITSAQSPRNYYHRRYR